MRILTDPDKGITYYEKMPHGDLPMKTQYMELFNELWGSRLAGYLGIPAPKTKLGFKGGDIFSPVTLSEDFGAKGWQTLIDRLTSSTQIVFGKAAAPELPPLDVLEKQLTGDLGKLTGFVSLIKSADTLANQGNMLITPQGKLGALDFGFAWDKSALFPDLLTKTETILNLRQKYLEILRLASFGQYGKGTATVDWVDNQLAAGVDFDHVLGRQLAAGGSKLTDEQFARYVYRRISSVADSLGSGSVAQRLMSLVLKEMTPFRPDLDLRMPIQTIEEMISLQSIFRDKKMGKLAGGGYINPSYLSNMGMPSFKTGVNYLYDDTIAQLHQGEAVLPENINPWNPAATNPIGGNTYYVAPVINAAPGMDENAITDLAVTKVMAAFKQAENKVGSQRNINRRYA